VKVCAKKVKTGICHWYVNGSSINSYDCSSFRILQFDINEEKHKVVHTINRSLIYNYNLQFDLDKSWLKTFLSVEVYRSVLMHCGKSNNCHLRLWYFSKNLRHNSVSFISGSNYQFYTATSRFSFICSAQFESLCAGWLKVCFSCQVAPYPNSLQGFQRTLLHGYNLLCFSFECYKYKITFVCQCQH
jgi:hypothetical protein